MRLPVILKNPDIRNAVAQCEASANPTNPNFIRIMDENIPGVEISALLDFVKQHFRLGLTQPAYRIACNI